mgnify:CR=1 FL=1
MMMIRHIEILHILAITDNKLVLNSLKVWIFLELIKVFKLHHDFTQWLMDVMVSSK